MASTSSALTAVDGAGGGGCVMQGIASRSFGAVRNERCRGLRTFALFKIFRGSSSSPPCLRRDTASERRVSLQPQGVRHRINTRTILSSPIFFANGVALRRHGCDDQNQRVVSACTGEASPGPADRI